MTKTFQRRPLVLSERIIGQFAVISYKCRLTSQTHGGCGASLRWCWQVIKAKSSPLSPLWWDLALNARPGRLVQLDAGDNASRCIKGLICNKSGRGVGLARRQHPPTAIRGRLDGCRSGSLRSTQVRRTYFQLQCFSPARTGIQMAKFPVLQQQQQQHTEQLSLLPPPSLSAQLARTIRKDRNCSLNLCAYVNGKKQMRDNCAGDAAQTSIWMRYLSCQFIYVNTLL